MILRSQSEPPPGKTVSRSRRYDRRLWVLFLGRVITSTGYSIAFPFFGIYFHTSLGVSMSTVGAIIAFSTLMGAFGKLLGGELADKIGRKRVMIAALFGRSLATAALALLAAQAEPQWLPMSALFIVGTWFGFFFDPAAEAMVADLSDPSQRVQGYSLLRVGGNLGWAVGGGVGGLIGIHSYASLFFGTAVVTMVALATLLLLVVETRPERVGRQGGSWLPPLLGPGSPLSQRAFLHFALATLAIHIVMSQLSMSLSVYGKTALALPESMLGLLFTINGMIIVMLQIPAASWIGRRRLTTSVAIGCLLYAAGYGSASLAVDFWTLAGCVVVFSFGELLVAPSVVSLAANLAPAELRGRFLGAFGLFSMLGRCLGPLLGGVNLDFFRSAPWIHWLVISGLAGGSMLLFLGLRGRVGVQADRP